MRLPRIIGAGDTRDPSLDTFMAERRETMLELRGYPEELKLGGATMTELPGPEDIDRVTDALIECGTSEEFIERVRTA